MGPLETFPLSYKVAGRRILIVGGGEPALAKARLAVRTSAAVRVVARRFTADFSGLEVELRRRGFASADLDGAALVFVADHGPDGKAAVAAARARGIPVNAVDQPEDCDFYTPAIVERAPITVAIASEGASPVLARLIRARIEALLGPETGALARLAGAMRPAVARLLPEGPARRRYYERLLTDPGVSVAVEEGRGAEAAEALLATLAEHEPNPGFVSMIGAGPGAADLLTLRAHKLLQEADVIVHDRDVPEAVLAMGRRDAERVAVGPAEAPGVGALLVRLARAGGNVVRLTHEEPAASPIEAELAALELAGISHVIVPGVSASQAEEADAAARSDLAEIDEPMVA